MGKKTSNKRSRSQEEEEEEEIDPDILAEIEAFRDLQKEKYPQVKSLNVKEGLVEKDKQEHENFNPAKKSTYNKDGLLRCIENMDTANLPFLETMRICRYNVDIPDENDDLQREVFRKFVFYDHQIHSYILMN